MNNIETELVSSEVSHDWSYLKPIKYVPLWRRVLELIAFAAILSALIYGILWLASIGAF
jgi:hypothetical protein